MRRASMPCCAAPLAATTKPIWCSSCEDGLLTLGVVATDDEGGVVGYAAFSPVDVAGEDRQWVALAPLAVDESLRRRGWLKSWFTKAWIR